jgi:hypothetical protein
VHVSHGTSGAPEKDRWPGPRSIRRTDDPGPVNPGKRNKTDRLSNKPDDSARHRVTFSKSPGSPTEPSSLDHAE